MTTAEKLLDNLRKMTPDEVTKAVRDALDMSGIEWTDDGTDSDRSSDAGMA